MRTMTAHRILAVGMAALTFSAPAWGAWPDDVQLSQLGTWQGESFTNTDTIAQAYDTVIRELGTSIANPVLGAPETTGIHGFDIALTSTVGFLSTDESWARVHEEASPSRALWVPGVTVRKGLPLSLEVGSRLGYVAFSRQTVFGAWGRAALLEGYRKLPDITIQAGYSGYIGNPELALGTMDLSAVLGKSFPFGRLVGINTATVSPWIGGGVYRIRALPRIDDALLEDYEIGAVSGFTKSPDYAEGYAPLAGHVGFRVKSGDVQFMMSSALVPGASTTLSLGLGYVY